MPELPEVEVVKETLKPHLVGRKIIEMRIYHQDIIREPMKAIEKFQERILNHSICDIERYGKYLILVLDAGWLVTHLRMTGKLIWRNHCTKTKHMHFVGLLDDDSYLLYEDVRRFGGFSFYEKSPYQQAPFNKLGPDALSDSFTGAYLSEQMQGRRRNIKSLLLDQQVVAGLGNIYVDEILAFSGIHPQKSVAQIDQKTADDLVGNIKFVLNEAIQLGGSSIRDYTDGHGQRGYFQNKHRVYGRAGAPCYNCGEPLEKVNISGRSTVYCPHCQS